MSTEPITPPERFLRAQEVADRLNVHVSTVYRLADSGRLRAHRIGEGRLRKRGLRVPESAVTDYLADSLITPAEVAA
ncbi:helix-turn-helix domain-containing protein [Streptomyces platensis]|uniref:helix-turn-helix domain-containing protein n=1 Tax=Streptomyces platensis TaxID=58346 RepID=UPI002E1406F6|nr:helix-turn-helix domain-containing protein [Streptomyces platensis]